MERTFYTYMWLRYDGTPYYIGKGSGRRAFIGAARRIHKPLDKARILIQEFPDEQSAFAAEKFLISYYGRLDLETGCLRNLTDGGEGPSGFIAAPETRRKISESKKNLSPESRLRMSLSHRDQKISAEHVAALRSGFENMSEESRLKMENGYKNSTYVRTAEHAKKIGDALRGRKASAETKAKLSAIRAGRKLSPAHSAAIKKGINDKVSKERRSEIARLRNQIRWHGKPIV
jgi:phosphosulfolactate synthase (CoM biosynthesis protein A)